MKWERRITLGSLEVALVLPERARKARDHWRAPTPIKSLLGSMVRSLPGQGVGDSQRDGRGYREPALSPYRRPVPSPAQDLLDAEGQVILTKIAGIDWYHSIDLGHGVVTPGFVDHRAQLRYYHFPQSLEGRRCLDVATADGFWAFEMERRGAAEVVALDVARISECDVPKLLLDEAVKRGGGKETGQGFHVASDLLCSRVQRLVCNVYDLTPERSGKFDFVFVSDLLLHLRNPQLALERIFSVCQGDVLVAEVYNPRLERLDGTCLSEFSGTNRSLTWWMPNTNTLKMMMTIAGFEPVEELGRFVLNARTAERIHKVVLQGHVPHTPFWRARMGRTSGGGRSTEWQLSDLSECRSAGAIESGRSPR